jgi:hypothetical protein
MYTIFTLASRLTGGDERAVRKLLNDAGAGLDEFKSDPSERVSRAVLVDLLTMWAGDRVGRILGDMLQDPAAKLRCDCGTTLPEPAPGWCGVVVCEKCGASWNFGHELAAEPAAIPGTDVTDQDIATLWRRAPAEAQRLVADLLERLSGVSLPGDREQLAYVRRDLRRCAGILKRIHERNSVAGAGTLLGDVADQLRAFAKEMGKL